MSYANYEGQESQYERVLTDLTVVLSGSLYLLPFFATVLSTDRPNLCWAVKCF